MVKNGEVYFIDFQSGRIGPIEYDIASILIDPYVRLSKNVQTKLFNYCIDKLLSYSKFDKKKFYTCFQYCRITRNLQILGAFCFLSSKKNKKWFKEYIPIAAKILCNNLAVLNTNKLNKLKAVANRIEHVV